MWEMSFNKVAGRDGGRRVKGRPPPPAELELDLDIMDVGVMSKWTSKVQRNRLIGIFYGDVGLFHAFHFVFSIFLEGCG